jgi:hypothetical protein
MVSENQTDESGEISPFFCMVNGVQQPDGREWWNITMHFSVNGARKLDGGEWWNVTIPLQCEWCQNTRPTRMVKCHHSIAMWMVSENQTNKNGELSLFHCTVNGVRRPDWQGWWNVTISLHFKWCQRTRATRMVKCHHSIPSKWCFKTRITRMVKCHYCITL